MLEATVARLIGLAEQERWDEIDRDISRVSKDRGVVEWAYRHGLYESNDQVRDLAASILEKADWGENFNAVRDLLYSTLRDEKHPYAKFRMACALYAHGERKPDVVAALENAPADVKSIAQKYLNQK